MGSKKNKESKATEKALKEQNEIANQSLQLEQQRMALEQQAAAERANEMSLLQQQLNTQSQAYTSQISLLQQQQQQSESSIASLNGLLTSLSQAQTEQQQQAAIEKQRIIAKESETKAIAEREAYQKQNQTANYQNANAPKRDSLLARRKRATPVNTLAERRALLSVR